MIVLFCLLGVFGAGEDSRVYEQMKVVRRQIQVNVTDRAGQPITDLKPEEIQLTVNGEIKAILSMESVAFDTATPGQEHFEPTTESQNNIGGNKTGKVEIRRVFALMLDWKYSNPNGMKRSLTAADDFINNQKTEHDLIGLFAVMPSSEIIMLTNFTRDNQQLQEGLARAGFGSAPEDHTGGYYNLAHLYHSRNREKVHGAKDGTVAGVGIDGMSSTHLRSKVHQTTQYYQQVKNFYGAFEEFAHGLSVIEGRKNLVWLSNGLSDRALIGGTLKELHLLHDGRPMIGGNAMFTEYMAYDLFGRGDVADAATNLVRTMQDSGVVMYAVKNGGRHGGAHTMNMFSADTGGRALLNHGGNVAEALGKIRRMNDHYYVLTFEVDGNDQSRDARALEVAVDRPGVRIQAPRALSLKPEFDQLSEAARRMHLSEFINNNRLIRDVPLEAQLLQTAGLEDNTCLAVQVSLPSHYFFLGQQSLEARDMEVYTMAFQQEHIVDINRFAFRFDPDMATPSWKKNGLKIFDRLSVAPGDTTVKVIVRDLKSGKVGTWFTGVPVSGDANRITGPILCDKRNWAMIMNRANQHEGQPSGMPFLFKGNHLAPNSTGEVSVSARESFYVELAGSSSGKLPMMRLFLEDATGKVIPIPESACVIQADLVERGYGILVDIDMASLGLEEETEYKLLTMFREEQGKTFGTRFPFRTRI